MKSLRFRVIATVTRHFLSFAFLLSLSLPGFTHEGEHKKVAAVAPSILHHPTAMPDRIVLTWTGDPSTSQTVTWRTDVSVTRALAQVVIAADGPSSLEPTVEIVASTKTLQSDLGAANYHTAALVGLKPTTRYAYRVGDGTNWSEWSHFDTASSEMKPFTFVYFGDAQNNLRSQWSRVVREAFRDAPRAAFFLHAGDLINDAGKDQEWGDWFYASGFIHRTIPCIAAAGNHEYISAPNRLGKMVAPHWNHQFAFPANGPELPELSGTAYRVDFQGTRIISLDSNILQSEQMPWLEEQLKETGHRWTIVTFHHPIYSSFFARDNSELRKQWQPLFEKYGVDLVLQGHDHSYARTHLLGRETNLPSGVQAQEHPGGTVYVVSVSGPKMYPVAGALHFSRTGQNRQLYQVIRVNENSIEYEARTAAGKLFDSFILKKDEAGNKQLIEGDRKKR